MAAMCGRCREPIRGFKGYDAETGEICFTCYLEMLKGSAEKGEKKTQVVLVA